MFTLLALTLIVATLFAAALFTRLVLPHLKPGRTAGTGRPRRLTVALAAVFALVVMPVIAHAANTVTFGQATFTYFDSGRTNLTILSPDGGKVLCYLTLTSAQTTSMRAIYGTPSTASGGSTGTEPKDGTATLPGCAPNYGDLTD